MNFGTPEQRRRMELAEGRAHFLRKQWSGAIGCDPGTQEVLVRLEKDLVIRVPRDQVKLFVSEV